MKLKFTKVSLQNRLLWKLLLNLVVNFTKNPSCIKEAANIDWPILNFTCQCWSCFMFSHDLCCTRKTEFLGSNKDSVQVLEKKGVKFSVKKVSCCFCWRRSVWLNFCLFTGNINFNKSGSSVDMVLRNSRLSTGWTEKPYLRSFIAATCPPIHHRRLIDLCKTKRNKRTNSRPKIDLLCQNF